MQFNPTNYIHPNNYWSCIKNYILKKNFSQANQIDDSSILDFILDNAKTNLGKSYESFRKFISNYHKNAFHSFSRDNLFCLIFVFNIYDINEAQYFCRNIVHQNELSARSLQEFIILCGLKLHLSYSETMDICDIYSNTIEAMPNSPNQIQYKKTYNLLNDIIINNINSVDDLHAYLSKEENISIFARTRNTTYLMLFDEIGWELWDSVDWRNFFEYYTKYAPSNYLNYSSSDWDSFISSINNNGISNEMMKDLIIYYYNGPSNNCINEYLDQFYSRKSYEHQNAKQKIQEQLEFTYGKQSKPKCELKDYYLQRFSSFGLYLNSDDIDQLLTEEEINILSKNAEYSTAFLTYENYTKLFKRNRKIEIPAGVFLLSLIQKNSSLEDEYPLDYTNAEDFIDSCNEYLNLGGFPSLNPNNNFDKLFIDTYNHTLTMFPDEDSLSIKEIFLLTLIRNLKAIAKALK